MNLKRFLLVLGFFWILPTASYGRYPDRPISLVIPLGPGSITDISSRIIAEHLSEGLGRTVVPINKPGAEGAVAALYTKKEKPDGYTLFAGTMGSLLIRPMTNPESGYDATEFSPIGQFGFIAPLMLVTHKNVPVKNFREFKTFLNKRESVYATTSATSVIASAQLLYLTKVKAKRISFKSDPEALQQGLLTKDVPWMFVTASIGQPFVASGDIVPLAILSERRDPLFPNVPTFLELGVPMSPRISWLGIVGPPGMQETVVQTLSRRLKTVTSKQVVQDAFKGLSMTVAYSSPAGFSLFIRNEAQSLRKDIDVLRKEGLLE